MFYQRCSPLSSSASLEALSSPWGNQRGPPACRIAKHDRAGGRDQPVVFDPITRQSNSGRFFLKIFLN